MSEKERFELSNGFTRYTISSRAPSTKLGDFSIFSFVFINRDASSCGSGSANHQQVTVYHEPVGSSIQSGKKVSFSVAGAPCLKRPRRLPCAAQTERAMAEGSILHEPSIPHRSTPEQPSRRQTEKYRRTPLQYGDRSLSSLTRPFDASAACRIRARGRGTAPDH